ncbi:hypothetical protein [Streptomyces bobili]|uniref:hypothetical protein n=1 Tax=Streptomyces bobili TaxID=67280 RepID=UPI0037A90DC2
MGRPTWDFDLAAAQPFLAQVAEGSGILGMPEGFRFHDLPHTEHTLSTHPRKPL